MRGEALLADGEHSDGAFGFRQDKRTNLTRPGVSFILQTLGALGRAIHSKPVTNDTSHVHGNAKA